MLKKIFKGAYGLIPFKKNLFSLLKIFWVPKKSVTQHLYFNDDIAIKVDKKSSFKMHHYGYIIENELFWHGLKGAWEATSFDIWTKLSRDAKVVMDVGANTGVYSLLTHAVNQNAKIYAFEPINSVHLKLHKNVKLNGFEDNISTNEVALSNFIGEAEIFLEKTSTHALSVTVNKSLLPIEVEYRTEKIKTNTLENFIEQNNITRIDLMKIDVETHEPEVLEGMGKYLAQFKPVLLIEILNDEIGAKVQELVNGLGYLYFNIDDEGYKVEKVSSITKSAYFNYLLCDNSTAKQLGIF